MTTKAPATVAVVVATYNREGYLRVALEHLAAQADVVDEIVVVDDCSTDGTPRLLAAADGLVRSLRTATNSGPAVARNAGWRATSSTWVAFTDDDCEVQPGWVAALLEEAVSSGADIVQGRTIPHPGHPRGTPWAKAVNVRRFSHRYQTCNLLVRRSTLEAVGGFDESFPFAGEDADLGWRATKAGFRASFADGALVYHAIRPQSSREYLSSRRGWAQLTQFYKRHPEARFLLWGGVFHHRTHLTAPILLVGLALLGQRTSWAVPLAVFLAHATANAHRAGGNGRSFANRMRFALLSPFAEVWEGWNFALQSLRHRTLVL